MESFDVRKIRKDFPILSRKVHGKPLIYLDSAATSQKPRQVISAISDFYTKHNSNVHRGVHTLSGEATEMVESAREKVASFIGSKHAEEVIFVRNATEAINLVLYTWGSTHIKGGDRIVVTLLEHHSNLVGWQQLAGKTGAELGVVETSDEGVVVLTGGKTKRLKSAASEASVLIGSLSSLLDSSVKLVALTHVSNVLGTILPMERVVSLIRKKSPKALILVDASQSVPHMPVDVGAMDVDFLVFSGHKMLGPSGIGVLWGRKRLLTAMPPFLFGGDMISEVELSRTVWNRLPWKFEAGTPNMAGMVGMGAAVQYLRSVGMVAIRDHEKALTAHALERMERIEREAPIRLYGPRDPQVRGGVITFNVDGVHAHDAAQVFDSLGIAVRSGHHCAMPLAKRLGTAATVRASFYLYTTKKEVDSLVKGIDEVRKVFRV